jgi:hypothetical protein
MLGASSLSLKIRHLTRALPLPCRFRYYSVAMNWTRTAVKKRGVEEPKDPVVGLQTINDPDTGTASKMSFCYSDSRELLQRCWSVSPTSNRSDLHECRKLTRRTFETFAHHSSNSIVRRCLECLPHPVSFRRRPGSEQTPCNSSRPFSSSSASVRVDEAKDSNAFLASSVCVGIIEEDRWNHTRMGVERTHRLCRERMAEDTSTRL